MNPNRCKQGNLYTGGRLLYGLCSRQPTVELVAGALKNMFCYKKATKPIVG